MASTSNFGGSTTASAAKTPLAFGAATTTKATGFSFGLTGTSTAAVPPTVSLGSTTGTKPQFFGTATTAAATTSTAKPTFGLATSGFAVSSASSAAPTLTSGTAGLAPASTSTTTTVSSGFSFGTTAVATSASTLGIGFGSTTSASSTIPAFGTLGAATSTKSSLSEMLKSTTAASSTTAFGLGVSTAATSTAPTFKGLGGVDPASSTSSGASGKDGTNSDANSVKEQPLPQPLMETVAKFKEFQEAVRNQQAIISRQSVKPLDKVSDELATLRQSVATLTAGLQRSAASLEQLKAGAAQDLKDAEMAQRTKDTPAGLQYEHTQPVEYFQRLVHESSSLLVSYHKQVGELEQYMSTSGTQACSPQDLVLLLRRLHESFVALAAQLYSLNSRVETLREEHLCLRRSVLGDSADIFAAHRQLRENEQRSSSISKLEGPSAFQGVGSSGAAAAAVIAALNRSQQPQMTGVPQPAPLAGTATGFLSGGTNSGSTLGSTFGSTMGSTLGSGLTGFGSTPASTTATVKPFGVAAPLAQQTQATGFGTGSATFSFSQPAASNTPVLNQSSSFTLQNPPRKKRGN